MSDFYYIDEKGVHKDALNGIILAMGIALTAGLVVGCIIGSWLTLLF